ncbi:MAG TPA: GIY-YIG nuclease family protein [Candidatus Acidoferrales bacterium]|nr:GIY-YIG nuclease family protein [Candidatus Acidoferrales bacterium]
MTLHGGFTNDITAPMWDTFRGGFVYLLGSKSDVLYVGVTNNLYLRVLQHRQKQIEGFTRQYNVTRLVYYEQLGEIRDAIAREKQIKGRLRKRKIALIESTNPRWRDLFDDLAIPQPKGSIPSS